MASLVGAALARAQAFLIDPARPTAPEPPAAPAGIGALTVAVVGINARCGCSTVARGLAAALERPSRPAQVLDFAEGAVVEHRLELQALVWDIPARSFEAGSIVASRADAVIAVAAGSCEPALAEVVAGVLRDRLRAPLVVANRVRDASAWEGRVHATLPESRLGAVVAARGRVPGGALGSAFRQLAYSLEQRTA